MKQIDIDKFECKIKLNNAIEDKYISKKDIEFILKHILKSNCYLIKHYKLIKKDVLNEIFIKLNDLLDYGDFFINDKMLILWIARKLNNILKNKEYGDILKNYLKEKDEDSKNIVNKYNKQRNYRTIIKCDDDCFKDYLPIKRSEYYYTWQEKEYYNNSDEEMILYSQFDNELDNLSKTFVGNNSYKLTDEEIKCIKEFRFVNIDENKLLDEINNLIDEYKKDKNWRVKNKLYNNLLDYIYNFEGYNIRTNDKIEFNSIIHQFQYYLFDLLKDNMINYNVNDSFIILDNVDNKLFEINSLNEDDIISLIDYSQLIKYMQCHDISNLDEMYIDKSYRV